MMIDRRREAIRALAFAALAAPAACTVSPFQTTDADRGVSIARERIETVEPLGIERYAVEREPEEEVLDRPEDPFTDAAEIPVTLERARAWTLRNNLDLKVSLVDPTIANANLAEEEAAWEWTFLANGNFTKTDQPTSTTLAGSGVESQNLSLGVRVPMRTGGTLDVTLPFNRTETTNQFATLNPSFTADIEVSLSQPLLRNAGRRTNTHALRIEALQTQITEARTKLEVIRQLANADRAYWNVYAAQEALRVAYEQYELAYEQLEVAQRRVRARVDPQLEVVRAEEGVATRIQDIITAQNDYRAAQRELKRIINVDRLEMDSETLILLASEPDPVRYEIETRHMVDAALEKRMELLELELQLAQDFSTIDFQKNQALPLATLDYTYRSNGLGNSFANAFTQTRDFNFEDNSFGFNVEVPLGNEALDNLRTTWQAIIASQRSVILSRRVYEAEQNQFEAGTRTSTEVLEAATRLAEAQIAEIRALVDYQIAQVDLAFATGTLLGASRVQWEMNDPRGPEDMYGDRLHGPDIPVRN